ncbi:MAG TPA: NAD(P)-dependent oxidoreductase [Actinomycetes bacterium]|nr:NAD(P)-dependent oxidoreductase [Actinomycetes bacterium]
MRILVADALEASAVSSLEAAGHSCHVNPDLTADTVPDHIGDFEALIVRSTKVTADTIAAGKALQLIVRAGAGVNTIDVDAATAAGVLVTNVPGRNAAAVAELALGLMLAIDRKIPEGVIALRAGHWDKKGMTKGARGLKGSTLGIVGLGSIGLGVATRAQAFGMQVKALRRPGRPASTEKTITDLGIELLDSLPELAAAVDILSLHIPAGPDTKGIVDDEVLSAMKPGSVLINTSRADIVDADALLRALNSGNLRAGLDVYPDEPGTGTAEWTSPISTHPSVTGTHHVGASTQEAQLAVAEGVVDVVAAFVKGDPIHVVNPAARQGTA